MAPRTVKAIRRLYIIAAVIVVAVGWAATLRASTPYFVAMTGADTNDCFTLATACQHINAALAKASAGDIIIIADGTYTEDLTLDKDITLIGFGQDVTTLSGGGIARVMTVTANATVNLSDVTIADGSTGYPYLGSGIFVSGTLRLFNSTLTRNVSSFALYNVGTFEGQTLLIHDNNGGAIYNTGAGALRDGTVANNISGIWNYGTMRVSDSAILSHTTNLWPGAGIANYGTMTIGRTQIRANTVNYANGGGIYNAGTLTVSQSLVISNTAFTVIFPASSNPESTPHALGGGIHNDSNPLGILTVMNSALFGNSATSGGDQLYTVGTASLTNVTLSGDAGHGGMMTGGTVTLTNATINDMPSGVFMAASTFARNTIISVVCVSPITSLGHNLDSGNTCGFTATGDLTNTNPLLGPLQDNGGPTPTFAIPANSPAVNAGDNAGCPATDQRGIARPQAGRCDIGAYEYVFPVGVYLPFVAR